MYPLTMEEFTLFLFDKPADDRINHKDGWEYCAVGEFVANQVRRSNGELAFRETLDEFITLLERHHGHIYDRLNEAPNYLDQLATYGELAEYCQTHKHERSN